MNLSLSSVLDQQVCLAKTGSLMWTVFSVAGPIPSEDNKSLYALIELITNEICINLLLS